MHILLAERASRADPFPTGHEVTELSSPSSESDITLSADERVAVFTSVRPGGVGGTDLWYAVRRDRFATFSAPQLLPAINTASAEGEPFLSADGTELYFASDRPGGKGLDDIYRVTILARP